MQGEIRIPLNGTFSRDDGSTSLAITHNDIQNLHWLGEAMPDRDCNILVRSETGSSMTRSSITEWTTEPNPDNGRLELVIRFTAED